MQSSSGNSSSQDPYVPRPPFEHWYIYALLGLVSFFIADAAVTYTRQFMLPSQTTPGKAKQSLAQERKTRADYMTVTRRNIFNSDGKIPPPLSSEGPQDFEGPAVLSQLPLTLIGTIVHVDPSKSVATIQSRSNNKIQSYKVEGNIEGVAKVMQIERKRVVFRNLSNNRKEYIEIKDDLKINFGVSKVEASDAEEIKKEGNRFTLNRDLVQKATANLPELLQQARAVPNIVPNSGGRVEGFRLLEMEEGSIFEELGLKVQDVIKGVNGEPVDSPAKAMELYNALKNSQRIDLEVERNGRSEFFNYIVE